MTHTQPPRSVAVVGVALLAIVAVSAFAGLVAAASTASVQPENPNSGVATNHTWSTTYDGTSGNTIHNVTLDYSGTGTNLSAVTAGDVVVDVNQNAPTVESISTDAADEVLTIALNTTESPQLSNGDAVNVSLQNDAVVNPTGGEYGVGIQFSENTSTIFNATTTLSIHQVVDGTVSDDNGTAIGGATVSLHNDSIGSFSATANASGFYETTVPIGTYNVTAQADGYTTETASDVAVTDSGPVTQNFTLIEYGTVEGQVLDNDSAAGMENVTVELTDGQGTCVTNVTDTNGAFSLQVVPGDYTLSAAPELYTPDSVTNVSVESGQTTAANLSHTRIAYDVSVEHLNGTAPTTMPNVSLSDAGGMVQVDLENESSSMPQELGSLGVDNTTEFRVTVNLTAAYEPRLLLGSMRNGTWERAANGTGTDVVIEGSPTEQQFIEGDVDLQNWPSGSNDTADVAFDAMFSVSIDDLDYPQMDDATVERLNGTVLMTDAQVFSAPRYETVDGTDVLSLTIGGPHYTVNGTENDGYYEAFLPNTLLDDWSVSSTDDLAAAYNGSDSAFTATSVSGGMRISLDTHYSVGDVELSSTGDATDTDDSSDDPEPSIRLTSVGDATGTYAPGEEFVVEATFENVGDATGTSTVTLLADGTEVTSREITLRRGETVTVSLAGSIDDAGEYDLSVRWASAGTVTIDAGDGGDETATDDGSGGADAGDGTGETEDDTSGDEESAGDGGGGQPGFGIGIALVAVLSALLLRTRSGGR